MVYALFGIVLARSNNYVSHERWFKLKFKKIYVGSIIRSLRADINYDTI